MKRICITGGIGSGKSYVARILRADYGINIYDCDKGAKRLMNESAYIRSALTELIGTGTYVNGKLNKPIVAQFLLASESNKQAINAIVHPAVIEDFLSSGLQWMESAILYEARLECYVDYVVAVTAPREVRIQRVMQRDNISKEKAAEWIENQMSQEEIAARASFHIVNDGRTPLSPQIRQILSQI